MKFLPQSASRYLGRTILTAKMNSPHIFFVGGVAGVITGAVLACRSTLKLEETLDEVKADLEVLKTMKTKIGTYKSDEKQPYSEQEYYKDVGYVYTRSALKFGKLYGPALAVGSVSIAALTGSHIQLTKRNTALTMTLAAVTRAYDEYRIRVQEELGKERELDIYRGVTEETVEVDGKKQKVKVKNGPGYSQYARVFDETNDNWVKDAEINRIFLECQQNWMNQLLRTRGHVFLNEVYDALGMERSSPGAVVGWVIGGDGDGFVDFGLYEATSSMFMNKLERSIWLDFNVDGVIYDKIKE